MQKHTAELIGDKQREELEGFLANHDCHAGPEDGCVCGEVREQLSGISVKA